MTSSVESKPIQVAVVEDDDEIRANLGHRIGSNPAFRLLRSYGDAELALADLPRHKPDVVLTDINLPGMDGIECARELKAKMPNVSAGTLNSYISSIYDKLHVHSRTEAVVKYLNR